MSEQWQTSCCERSANGRARQMEAQTGADETRVRVDNNLRYLTCFSALTSQGSNCAPLAWSTARQMPTINERALTSDQAQEFRLARFGSPPARSVDRKPEQGRTKMGKLILGAQIHPSNSHSRADGAWAPAHAQARKTRAHR